MKAELFVHEAQKTSAIFGRNHNVSVQFRGDQACTNGSTIYLPAIDLTADVSDDTAAIMRGYIDHEAGHVRRTDFQALGEWAKTASDLERGLQNAIEDIWLEREVRRDYPGAARNLRATATAVNQEYLDEIDADDPRNHDPRFVGPVAITWEGRRDYGGETCEACLDRLPPSLRADVERWVEAIKDCEGTSDTIKLAERIAKEMTGGMSEASASESGAEPEPGDSGEEPEDESGAIDDHAEGDAEGDADEADDAQSVPVSGDSGEDDGEDSSGGNRSADSESDGESDDSDTVTGSSDAEDGDGEGSGNERDENPGHGAIGEDKAEQQQEDIQPYSPADVGQLLKDRLEADGAMGQAAQAYRPYTTEFDRVHHRNDPEGKYSGQCPYLDEYKDYTRGVKMRNRYSTAEYDRLLARMPGIVGNMRRKFERALMSKQQRDWEHGREQGRLDSRRFGAVVSGRRNVFKIRDDRRELDTAVSLLVDMSGSMDGDKAKIATQTVMAMGEVLNRAGIAFEVLGFANSTMELDVPIDYRIEKMTAIRRGQAHRTDPLDIYEFKRFDERLSVAKGVIWQIAKLVGGDNGDGEAVFKAFQRLRERPESRRVLLVLSDGHPVTAGCEEAQHRHLRQVVDDIERGDEAECVGIGICSKAVKRYYSRNVVVNRPQDLAGVAMDQLSKLLLGERFVVDNRKLGGV